MVSLIYDCINHVFCFVYSDALTSGPCWPRRDCPSQGNQFLENHPIQMQNQAIQSPHPLSFSHTPGHCPSALITPGPGTRQLGTAPMPWSLLTLFKLANPKPTYPASSVPSHWNHSESSSSHFPLSLCLLVDPLPPSTSSCVLPPQCDMFLLLEPVIITNYLFNGSSLLTCWPCPT